MSLLTWKTPQWQTRIGILLTAGDLCNMASQLQIQIHEINIYVVALTDGLYMKNPHSLQWLDNNIPMQISNQEFCHVWTNIFRRCKACLETGGQQFQTFFFF